MLDHVSSSPGVPNGEKYEAFKHVTRKVLKESQK